jgi:adenylylsulfate kinase-like enzyme
MSVQRDGRAHEVHGNVYTERLKSPARANQTQQPCILWFTGLSGAGKSTIANAVEQELFQRGYHSYCWMATMRHGLNRDLGFLRQRACRGHCRIGEVSRLFVDAS